MSTRTKAVWAMAGAAPDDATCRALLSLLTSQAPLTLRDLLLLTSEGRLPGPAAGSLSEAAVPTAGPAVQVDLLAGALLADPDRVAAVHARNDFVSSRSELTGDQQFLWEAFALNPAASELDATAACRVLKFIGGGSNERLVRALFGNWTRTGATPTPAMLEAAVAAAPASSGRATATHGVSPAHLDACHGGLTGREHTIFVAMRVRHLGTELTEHTPPAYLVWLLTHAGLYLEQVLDGLHRRGTDAQLTHPDVAAAVVTGLTRTRCGTTAVTRVMKRCWASLTPDQQAVVRQQYPTAVAGFDPVLCAATDADPEVFTTILNAAPGNTWLTVAAALLALPDGTATPVAALVTAAGAATGTHS